jgi:hypothetical protein
VATLRNERLTKQTIAVDGNRYEACVFRDCTLIYAGGNLPSFVNCTFRNVKLQVDDQALNTTLYLQSLFKSGLSYAAENVLQDVQQGVLALSQRPAPPPAVNTGDNYRQLGVYSAVLVGVAALLIAAIWYGFFYYPVNVALARDPAQPLFRNPLMAVYPALPDDLAISYDEYRAAQLEQLNSYGWVDEAQGIGRIPVGAAMDLIVEQGRLPAQPSEGN